MDGWIDRRKDGWVDGWMGGHSRIEMDRDG